MTRFVMSVRCLRALPLLLAVVCSGAIAVAGQQKPASLPAAERRGAISGVVTDAVSRSPIGGAIVRLSSPGPRAAVIPGPGAQVTDAAGRFVFTGLPAGSFTLMASRFGYFDGGYGRVWFRAGHRRIVLGDGEWFPEARITLWRHASIGGTVRDEVGEAVAGVWVRALARIFVAGYAHWMSGPVTRTDDRGVYRLAGLTPGHWIVMVPSVQAAVPADTSIHTLSGFTPEAASAMQAAGHAPSFRRDPLLAVDDDYRLLLGASPTPPPAIVGRPQTYPITFYPSARALTGAQAIDTTHTAEHRGVDLVIRPVPAFTVAGVVEGPAEVIANMPLRLLPEGGEDLGGGGEAATALADTTGRFVFFNVPAGSYRIQAGRSVAAYGYTSSGSTDTMPPRPGARGASSARSVAGAPPGTFLRTASQLGDASWSARAAVEITTTDLRDVAVRLTRGASISGRLVVEPASGSARPAGLPVASVFADPANGDPAPGQRGTQLNLNDSSRTFTIEGLQTGAHVLRVLGGGLVKSIVHDGRDYTHRPFDVSDGQSIADVIVTMTAQGSRLSGFVRDRQGRPATSTSAVICFPAEREQWSGYGVRPVRLRSVPVATDGGYTIDGLPAGDYLLVAVDVAHGDAWQDPAFLAKVATSATRASLGWDDEKAQSLTLLEVR
jgi:hypothetical protein